MLGSIPYQTILLSLPLHQQLLHQSVFQLLLLLWHLIQMPNLHRLQSILLLPFLFTSILVLIIFFLFSSFKFFLNYFLSIIIFLFLLYFFFFLYILIIYLFTFFFVICICAKRLEWLAAAFVESHKKFHIMQPYCMKKRSNNA